MIDTTPTFTINNEEFNYPTLCVSIIDNYLVFTTKKNGSRYFEDISEDTNHSHQCNTLNIFLHDLASWPSSDMYKFSNYVLETSPTTRIDERSFLNLLGIDALGELFSDKVLKKFKLIFIIRNPIERLFTGFFEKVDSIIAEIEMDRNKLFTYQILKKYFNFEEFNSLSNFSQDKINFILNEYVVSIDYKILNDEHLSLWNYFLLNFLQKENLLSKVKIIDLNDTDAMDIFPKSIQPSNKPWLSSWMTDETNKYYIDTMLLNLKPYMDLEIESYNILLNKKDG